MLQRFRRTDTERRNRALLAAISHHGRQLKALSLSELPAKFHSFTTETSQPGDRQLALLLACVAEAVHRRLDMELYPVQLLAGIALTRGGVVQMETGEGKTLVAALPASVHGALNGSAHVMTVNDYLARRDFELMRPVYESLGLSVGLTHAKATASEKRTAYACQVTYGTGSEFGFDFLRDQLVHKQVCNQRLGTKFQRQLMGAADSLDGIVQRKLQYALVDEADSVLIDEANSSLILSESSGRSAIAPQAYLAAKSVSETLEPGKDYNVDTASRHVVLLPRGQDAVRKSHMLLDDFPLRRPWTQYVEQALRARDCFARDIDYVVIDNQVQIVDVNTGRRFEDRSWRDGLHQAIEAEEGVVVTEESQSLLRVTRQRYLSQYERLAGLTGTAEGCAQEFAKMYRLPTVGVPRHQPCRRIDDATRYFVDGECRDRALVDDVVAVHGSGQPILVGTRTIKHSEQLAMNIEARGLNVRLLNAKQDAHEADLISHAGQFGAITIATNMAGRGTDIALGANVADLGGLYVFVAEANLSRRIDRQLMGRAARHGDPGRSRRYVAASDELIAKHSDDLVRKMLRVRHDDRGEIHQDFDQEVLSLQSHLDRQGFDDRKKLVKRDDWITDVLKKAS